MEESAKRGERGLTLSLKDLDSDLGLVVSSSGEDLALLCGDGGISVEN